MIGNHASKTSRPFTISLTQYYAFALNPWSVIGFIILGALFGKFFPDWGRQLSFIGVIYVDLIKMIVLPFMVATIIFSLPKIFDQGKATSFVSKFFIVFFFLSIASVISTLIVSVLFGAGDGLGNETRQTLGKIIGANAGISDTRMSLFATEANEKKLSIETFVSTFIPSNVFASLSNGETLKTLIFAMLFGLAVGHVPTSISSGLTRGLETIYRAGLILTRWINLPIPFVLFSMAASQLADVGIEPIVAMASFVGEFFVSCLILCVLALWIMALTSRQSFLRATGAMREVFAQAVATNNAISCMPAMIEGLSTQLGFKRTTVELVVPITTSLLRIGAMTYFVSATLFIAHLYEKHLTGADYLFLLLASILAGFSSAGMTGVVTISLLSNTAGLLGLPFEAAYILFVIIDPVCAMARTVVTVFTGAAAIGLICDPPSRALNEQEGQPS